MQSTLVAVIQCYFPFTVQLEKEEEEAIKFFCL